MKPSSRKRPPQQKAARVIRERIEKGGDRLWRLEDFRDLPATAAAQALSRLAKAGVICRLSHGTYHLARQTAFGPYRPNPAAVRDLAARHKTMFPAGMAAANLLGFTTQVAKRSELATSALSLPRKLVGSDAIIHTRRPENWASLSRHEAAILDFLRRGGRTTELPPDETIARLMRLLAKADTYSRLVNVARSEPPRVRALLGALGERLQVNPRTIRRLRDSLNPLSKFDFGVFERMANAGDWQAKKNAK